MYGGAVALEIVLPAKRSFATTMRANEWFRPLRVVRVHVRFEVKRAREGWHEGLVIDKNQLNMPYSGCNWGIDASYQVPGETGRLVPPERGGLKEQMV